MTTTEKVNWLNERDPFRDWSVDDDVFCLHCDGVFKVQDVACRSGDCPTCPVCHDGTPLDFAEIPWWREDLVSERANKHGFVRKWRGEPVRAVAGKPGQLPPRKAKRSK